MKQRKLNQKQEDQALINAIKESDDEIVPKSVIDEMLEDSNKK